MMGIEELDVFTGDDTGAHFEHISQWVSQYSYIVGVQHVYS